MSKPPLFFIVIIGLIVVAASFRFMQQRREKADNDMAPLQQKLVVVSNKREKPINDRRSRQQEVTPQAPVYAMRQASNRKAEEWSRRFASTPSSTTP
ncbi:putative receptor [Escherichia coli]|nr:putative receptor [Escherichia coli]